MQPPGGGLFGRGLDLFETWVRSQINKCGTDDKSGTWIITEPGMQ